MQSYLVVNGKAGLPETFKVSRITADVKVAPVIERFRCPKCKTMCCDQETFLTHRHFCEETPKSKNRSRGQTASVTSRLAARSRKIPE